MSNEELWPKPHTLWWDGGQVVEIEPKDPNDTVPEQIRLTFMGAEQGGCITKEEFRRRVFDRTMIYLGKTPEASD